MSSSNEGVQICYLLILIISIGFLVWGFMDILKKPTSKEESNDKVNAAVISRQIRGFAFIMLAHVIFVLGAALCTGLFGGLASGAKKILS